MDKIAIMFAGQGDQYPGMGKELYETSPAAKEVFDMAEALRPGTIRQCFEGTPQELMQTENTQPCLYCVDLAAAMALSEAGLKPDFAAGFSLGELAALTFSKAVGMEVGFRLVTKRGELMKEAAGKVNSVMAAVLKLDNETVESLCGHYDQVYPVNYNCKGQLVVAGVKEEVDLFKEEAREKGATVLMLPLSGGFHSPFMESASVAFEKELREVDFHKPELVLYSNYTARPYPSGQDKQEYVSLLSRQIANPVRWQQLVEHMHREGAKIFIEVGAGKTLSKLVRRMIPGAQIYNVENKESLEQTLQALKEKDLIGSGHREE